MFKSLLVGFILVFVLLLGIVPLQAQEPVRKATTALVRGKRVPTAQAARRDGHAGVSFWLVRRSNNCPEES